MKDPLSIGTVWKRNVFLSRYTFQGYFYLKKKEIDLFSLEKRNLWIRKEFIIYNYLFYLKKDLFSLRRSSETDGSVIPFQDNF